MHPRVEIMTGEVESTIKRVSDYVVVQVATMMTALKALFEHTQWAKAQSNACGDATAAPQPTLAQPQCQREGPSAAAK